MPQITGAIVVKDGSAVPANVSYSPELLSSAETVLVDRREASREAQPTITVRFDRASANRKTFKPSREFALPLIRTVNGVSTVTDIARAKTVYTLPSSMTLQERKHLRAMVANTEDVPVILAGVEDLDPFF